MGVKETAWPLQRQPGADQPPLCSETSLTVARCLACMGLGMSSFIFAPGLVGLSCCLVEGFLAKVDRYYPVC